MPAKTMPDPKTAVLQQRLTRWVCLTVGALAMVASPAHALTGSTPATSGSFAHIGSVDIASGVLIAPNWVLTAAHVGGVGATFVSGLGSAPITARYAIAGHSLTNNDIGLLYLATPIAATLFPAVNDTAIGAADVAAVPLGVTMSSRWSSVPGQPGYAATEITAVINEYTQSGTTTTPNWLIASGAVQVESGDSGSGVFLGAITDTADAVLLGLNSARLGTSSGQVLSSMVQVAPYRAWIDATMTGQTPGQSVRWTSVTPVPEAPAAAMLILGLGLVLRRQARHGPRST